ncbi:response regulator [Halomonas sp. I5-271120]|uniref:response regulator n=1 Tax=Halomonas sp. I5-271120 TaxID=3061632 RepID=UPI0027147F26|nr:response regulator [Halomonas sp. I5-271120]
MRVETRPDSLWQRLIWPVLWPLLLAEASLVTLCAVAWVMIWRASLSVQSASLALAVLMLVMLVGTGLIVSIFLVMVRHRLQRWETHLGVPYERLERLLREVQKELPSWLKPKRVHLGDAQTGSPVTRLESLLDSLDTLLSRLTERPQLEQMLAGLSVPAFMMRNDVVVDANTAFEQLMGCSKADLKGLSAQCMLRCDDPGAEWSKVRLHDSKGGWHGLRMLSLRDRHDHELGILDPLDNAPDYAGQLIQARDRAREDSRLKSTYMSLLQRELEPLVQELSQYFTDDAAPPGQERLRERLADITALVTSLSEPMPELLGQPAEPAEKSDRAPYWPKVLVVDDGPVNSMLARNVLEAEGFDVDVAESGEQALTLAAEQFYDLVFMDIYMPTLDGLETSRRWRAREALRETESGESERSVLIALTANASEADCANFRSVGMDDHLAKPYRPQALVKMIWHWLPGLGRAPG